GPPHGLHGHFTYRLPFLGPKYTAVTSRRTRMRTWLPCPSPGRARHLLRLNSGGVAEHALEDQPDREIEPHAVVRAGVQLILDPAHEVIGERIGVELARRQ